MKSHCRTSQEFAMTDSPTVLVPQMMLSRSWRHEDWGLWGSDDKGPQGRSLKKPDISWGRADWITDS